MLRRCIVPIVSATALAACGGDAAPQGQRVVLRDFAIDPAEVRLTGDVVLDVVNESDSPHRLRIEGPGGRAETETLESRGDSVKLGAELPPGAYSWSCPIGKHAERGMRGTLTVE